MLGSLDLPARVERVWIRGGTGGDAAGEGQRSGQVRVSLIMASWLGLVNGGMIPEQWVGGWVGVAANSRGTGGDAAVLILGDLSGGSGGIRPFSGS